MISLWNTTGGDFMQNQNKPDRRSVAIIGAGRVGMSCAYALLNQRGCDELLIVDVDHQKAICEAADLSHGLAFSSAHMSIRAASYAECAEADIAVICAGVAQAPYESRINLLGRNSAVFDTVVTSLRSAGFDGIWLVASNPVDIMTRLTYELSGADSSRVIGSGTTLDTARLRLMLGRYFGIDPRNIHAYVMGEHGDSEFVPWTQALVSTKPVLDVVEDNPGRFDMTDLLRIADDVRSAGPDIAAVKGTTCYGIGMALARIIRAIFGDEHSVLTVSSELNGAYGQRRVFAGSPAIIGRSGVEQLLRLSLDDFELGQFAASCEFLDHVYTTELGVRA